MVAIIMSKLTEVFGKNLMLRMGKMSQRQLSIESKVNQGSLSQILSGNGNPSLETVEAISKALGAHPSILLGGSDGKIYEVPQDILEMLEDQSPAVYDTIRMFLKTLDIEKKKAKRKV